MPSESSVICHMTSRLRALQRTLASCVFTAPMYYALFNGPSVVKRTVTVLPHIEIWIPCYTPIKNHPTCVLSNHAGLQDANAIKCPSSEKDIPSRVESIKIKTESDHDNMEVRWFDASQLNPPYTPPGANADPIPSLACR